MLEEITSFDKLKNKSKDKKADSTLSSQKNNPPSKKSENQGRQMLLQSLEHCHTLNRVVTLL